MRGKELLIARHFDDARITPAYAGSREKNGGGSLDVRITPACAGKRLIQARHAVKRQDHPAYAGKRLKKIP